jgi:hypothetical protein
MTWLYWDTFCSLLGSVVWFMTIVSHPDAEVRATQNWRAPEPVVGRKKRP